MIFCISTLSDASILASVCDGPEADKRKTAENEANSFVKVPKNFFFILNSPKKMPNQKKGVESYIPNWTFWDCILSTPSSTMIP